MDQFLTWWRRMLSTAMFIALLAPIAPAAEIIVRERVTVEAGIVRLADVAQIVGSTSSVEQLGSLELFPAPASGARRLLRIRELQDMLAERQVNLLDNRLTGSSVVEIVPARALSAKPAAAPAAVNMTRAKHQLHTALVAYLKQQDAQLAHCVLTVEVNESAARALQQADFQFEIHGGQQPWIGRQRFEIVAAGQPESLDIEAEISKSPMIVATVRALGKGAIVQASDVVLVPLGNQRLLDTAVTNLDDVIGRETTQATAAGQMLTQKSIQPQRLIQKGNIVTVYARSTGLKVRTTARAKEDGGLGAVIAVESVLNRQAFFARVTGIDECEVYARAIEARDDNVATRSVR